MIHVTSVTDAVTMTWEKEKAESNEQVAARRRDYGGLGSSSNDGDENWLKSVPATKGCHCVVVDGECCHWGAKDASFITSHFFRDLAGSATRFKSGTSVAVASSAAACEP